MGATTGSGRETGVRGFCLTARGRGACIPSTRPDDIGPSEQKVVSASPQNRSGPQGESDESGGVRKLPERRARPNEQKKSLATGVASRRTAEAWCGNQGALFGPEPDRGSVQTQDAAGFLGPANRKQGMKLTKVHGNREVASEQAESDESRGKSGSARGKRVGAWFRIQGALFGPGSNRGSLQTTASR